MWRICWSRLQVKRNPKNNRKKVVKKKPNLSLKFLISSCWKSNTAKKTELLSACDSTIRKTGKQPFIPELTLTMRGRSFSAGPLHTNRTQKGKGKCAIQMLFMWGQTKDLWEERNFETFFLNLFLSNQITHWYCSTKQSTSKLVSLKGPQLDNMQIKWEKCSQW